MSVLVGEARVTSQSTFPSTTSSSTAVTVTCCVWFQSLCVNVSCDGDTLPSEASSPLTPITTSAVGLVASFTVNVAVLPDPEASVTVRLVALNSTAASSSATFTVKSTVAAPSYSAEVSAFTVVCMSLAVSGRESSSESAETVTVCAVFQLPGPKVRSSVEPAVPVPVFTFTSGLSLATLTFTLPVGRTLIFTV